MVVIFKGGIEVGVEGQITLLERRRMYMKYL